MLVQLKLLGVFVFNRVFFNCLISNSFEKIIALQLLEALFKNETHV